MILNFFHDFFQIQFHYTTACANAEDMMHLKQRELVGDK